MVDKAAKTKRNADKESIATRMIGLIIRTLLSRKNLISMFILVFENRVISPTIYART